MSERQQVGSVDELDLTYRRHNITFFSESVSVPFAATVRRRTGWKSSLPLYSSQFAADLATYILFTYSDTDGHRSYVPYRKCLYGISRTSDVP